MYLGRLEGVFCREDYLYFEGTCVERFLTLGENERKEGGRERVCVCACT